MSSDEVHFEELIERERAGLATAEELERLQAHLAACPECRAERTLAAQAQADAAPLPTEAQVVARLRRRLAEKRPALRSAWLTRLQSPTALALFALTLASGATAALLLERVVRSRTAAAPSPNDFDEASSSSSAELSPILILADQRSPSAVAPPERLLAAADRARRAGQPEQAAALYRRLQRMPPGSDAHLVSHVSLGQLLLGPLHDPGAALVQFDQYLAHPSHRALRAEALLGRAVSLQRLGRRSEEEAAWQALLKDYPSAAKGEGVEQRPSLPGSL